MTVAGAGTVIGNFSSVETVRVTNGGAATDEYTINMIGATDVTELGSRLSSGDVTYTNVQSAAKLSAFGTIATTSQLKATFANTLASGAADSISLKADGAAAVTFEASGTTTSNVFETVNLESAGATKNTVALASTIGGGVKTLNVSGSGDLDITLPTGATAAVYDGSAATGKQTVTWGGNFVTVKGGSGADVVDATAGSLLGNTAVKTLVGGDGADKLIVVESITATTMATNAVTDGKHSISGFETVQMNVVVPTGTSGSNTDDVALEIQGDQVAGATIYAKLENNDSAATADSDTTGPDVEGEDGIATVSKLAAGQKVQFSAKASTAAAGSGGGTNDTFLVVSMKDDSGTSDSVSVESIAASATQVNNLTKLTVGRTASPKAVETVNLVVSAADVTSGGTTTVGTTIGAIDAQYSGTLNISGTGNTVIGTVELADPANVDTTINRAVIDASTQTGKLTLGSSSAAFKATGADEVSVTLGSNTNKVYFGTTTLSNDRVTGTTGTDTVYITEGSSSTALAMTLKDIDVLEITAVANDQTISAANFTNVGKITVVSSSDSGNSADDVTLSNIAAGQAIEVKTSSGYTFDDSDTLTVTVATGVTSAAVSLAGTDALASSGLTINTNAGQLSITDGIKDATGYYKNETLAVGGASSANLTKVTLSGGGAASATSTATMTLTAGSNIALTAIDATALKSNLSIASIASSTATGATVTLGTGNNTLTVAVADLARDALVVNGGDGNDTLVATTMDNATYRPALTSVETLNLTMKDASAGAVTFDLIDTSGVTTLALDLNGAEHGFTLSNGSVGTVTLAGDFVSSGAGTNAIIALDTAADVVVSNSAALGADDTVLTLAKATSVTLKQGNSSDIDLEELNLTRATSLILGGKDADTSGSLFAGAINANTLAAGELTKLTVETEEGNVTLGTVTAAKLASVTVTGDNAFSFGGTDASTAALASFDASLATGNITVGQAVDFTTNATVKFGSGDDTITLDILTEGGMTVDGGSKSGTTGDSDTLKLAGTNNLGLTVIDLTAADQVGQLNGGLNSAVQSNFENIDVSGLTGSFGANITGSTKANTIVGTANADNIVAGEGADTVTGGAGNDTIDLTESTAAADVVVFSAVYSATGTATDGADTITGFGIGDKIKLSTSVLALLVGSATPTAGTTKLGSDATTATSGTALVGTAADNKFAIAYDSSSGTTTIKFDCDLTATTDIVYETITLVGNYGAFDKWTFAADGIVYTG